MKIHLMDGSVMFERGSIGPDIDRPTFLKSPLGSESDVLVANVPYVTYRFRPEAGITATVSFVKDRLDDITWLMALPPEKEKEWTEELELERKQLHDDWLMRELGEPPYRYKWGEISSTFDPKGCVSDIILRYAR